MDEDEQRKRRRRRAARTQARRDANKHTPPRKHRGSDPDDCEPAPHRYRRFFHAPQTTPPGTGQEVGIRVLAEMADVLGAHAEKAGLVDVEEIRALARDDGTITVDDLPRATIRHDPPENGPDVWDNPGKWVPIDAPPPARTGPERLDLDDLSDEQADALAAEQQQITEALRRRRIHADLLAQADNPDAHRRRPRE